MSTLSSPASSKRARPGMQATMTAVAAIVVLGAMALSTKVVKIGSPAALQPGAFSPAVFGQTEFPKIQSAVADRAVDAQALAAAIAKDRTAAGKQYGVEVGGGYEVPVKFTGVAGKEDSGVYDVTVEGLPSPTVVRVQTGPAIMGTDLRDATGTIKFGQFTNQIEYQNAGSALNKEMKKEVLSKVVTGPLTGKTLSVTGVFQLTDSNTWLVTPVKLDVK